MICHSDTSPAGISERRMVHEALTTLEQSWRIGADTITKNVRPRIGRRALTTLQITMARPVRHPDKAGTL
jgi:hypothetical protein